MTISERMAELERRQAEQRADLEAEARIASVLPVEPYMVHFASKAEPWIIYKAKTITDALPILEAFSPVAGYAVDDGCLYVGPQRRERGKARWEAPELVEVTVERGRGFGGQYLALWTPVGEKVARIKIEVEQWSYKASPSCHVSYDRDGYVRDATHTLPELGEWKRVKWSSGSPDACRWSLYFDSRERAAQWLRGLAEPRGQTGICVP
jgi:hypothetical protein